MVVVYGGAKKAISGAVASGSGVRAFLLRGVKRLEQADVGEPIPTAGDIRIRVATCGVCRTDLDLYEGRLVPPTYPVIPGHQIVGTIDALGADVRDVSIGDRVGIAWIHSACGECALCRAGLENLCDKFVSTGCHVNGGYAEFATVPSAFAHRIPEAMDDLHVAPLLCAGAIGWRALRLTGIADGDSLGLTGFGASAHLVLPFARHRFPRSKVYVFARAEQERAFARELGADWAGATEDAPPEPLAAIIDTTPAWRPVVEALSHLRPGGRLVVNAIRKESTDQEELLRLDYATHLWREREIKSVANVTRADVREALDAALRIGLRPTVEELPLERANDALTSFRTGGAIRGAKVLRVAP